MVAAAVVADAAASAASIADVTPVKLRLGTGRGSLQKKVRDWRVVFCSPGFPGEMRFLVVGLTDRRETVHSAVIHLGCLKDETNLYVSTRTDCHFWGAKLRCEVVFTPTILTHANWEACNPLLIICRILVMKVSVDREQNCRLIYQSRNDSVCINLVAVFVVNSSPNTKERKPGNSSRRFSSQERQIRLFSVCVHSFVSRRGHWPGKKREPLSLSWKVLIRRGGDAMLIIREN